MAFRTPSRPCAGLALLLLGGSAAPAFAAVSATTLTAVDVTASTATLRGTADGGGLTAYAAFEYGLGLDPSSSSSYYGKSAVATPRVIAAGSGPTGLQAAISALSCNTTYHFRANANAQGSSASGADESFTTAACTAPDAPVIDAIATGNGAATITFSAPASNGGAPITTYTATASPGGASASCSGPAPCPLVISPLTNGTPYTIQVTATNSAVGTPGAAATGTVTPEATALGVAGVKVVLLNPNVTPSEATLEVTASNAGLSAANFTISNNTTPAAGVTVTGASYADGRYTITATGMSMLDTYTVTVAAGGYASYVDPAVRYGSDGTLAEINIDDEPNMFVTYARNLTAPGVLAISNDTYAADAKLYAGAVFDAIDSNNGLAPGDSGYRVIGVFAKAPAGAVCARTRSKSGVMSQVSTDMQIDGNPNYFEVVWGADAADDNSYWKTIQFVPFYTMNSPVRNADGSRTLMDSDDRLRLIEWYDSVDGGGNCAGRPFKVVRLLIQNLYTGNILIESAAPAPTFTGPSDTSVNLGGSASLSVAASGSGTLGYQWYSNASRSNSGGTLIAGAVGSSYSPPATSVGTTYYYVVVSNTVGSDVAALVSEAAQFTVRQDGVCGTAHGSGPLLAAPAADLCSVGAETAVSPAAGQFTWDCQGLNTGTDAHCAAGRGYLVSLDVGAGGSLTPNTAQTVAYNDTYSFTVTPQAGYIVESISGCGGTLAGNSYTTGAVTGACTVTARFAAILNGACGPAHGSGPLLTAPGTGLCSAGTATAVTSAPDQFTWSCLGANSGSNAACAAGRGYQVTLDVGPEGTVTPPGPHTVAYGATLSLTITPADRYAVQSATGCGGALSGSSYTTGPVAADCTVVVRFGIGQAVPTLSAWGLLLLSGLLGWFGTRGRRR